MLLEQKIEALQLVAQNLSSQAIQHTKYVVTAKNAVIISETELSSLDPQHPFELRFVMMQNHMLLMRRYQMALCNRFELSKQCHIFASCSMWINKNM